MPRALYSSLFLPHLPRTWCAHFLSEPLHTCCLLCGVRGSACLPYLKLNHHPQLVPPYAPCPLSALSFSIAVDTIQHRQCLLCSLFPVSAHSGKISRGTPSFGLFWLTAVRTLIMGQLQAPSVCMSAKSLQLCPTLCNPMNCSPTGSSVHGLLQARIVGWAAVPSSRRSS